MISHIIENNGYESWHSRDDGGPIVTYPLGSSEWSFKDQIKRGYKGIEYISGLNCLYKFFMEEQ